MDTLGKLQFLILVELSDNIGHSNRELSDKLKIEKSNLSTSLGNLEELGLIKRGESRISANPQSEGKKYRETPYFLETIDTENTANLIVDYAMKEEKLEELAFFLGSNYVDLMIREKSFDYVYSMWKKYFERSEFRKIASKSLLNQQSTIEEYEEYLDRMPDLIAKTSQEDCEIAYHRLGTKLYPFISGSYEQIEHLKNFDKLEAIQFYRGTLTEGLQDFSKNILKDPLIPNAFIDFASTDMYLSPFSSFPTNSIMDLLFDKPFERLYSDVYLIDYRNDLDLVISRALQLYLNFDEFLIFALNYFGYKKEYIELIIRQWIFYWNRSAKTIDTLIINLKNLESGKYHVSMDNLGHTIRDLERDNFLPRIYTNSLVIGDVDPFTNLIPCDCFDESEKQQRTIEEIIQSIKSK